MKDYDWELVLNSDSWERFEYKFRMNDNWETCQNNRVFDYDMILKKLQADNSKFTIDNTDYIFNNNILRIECIWNTLK